MPRLSAVGISGLKAGEDVNEISGSVARIDHQDKETGRYQAIVALCPHNSKIRVRGVAPRLTIGDHLQLVGEWGVQAADATFNASITDLDLAPEAHGAVAFLRSERMGRVGKTWAQKIAIAAGERFPEFMDRDLGTFLAGAGAKPAYVRKLTSAWQAAKSTYRVMAFLFGLGFGEAKAQRIHDRYGDDAESVIRDNPYTLLSLPGIGWVSADSAGIKLRTARDASTRIAAGLTHLITQRLQQGDCAIDQRLLLEEAVSLLELDRRVIDRQLDIMIRIGELEVGRIRGRHHIYLPSILDAEKRVVDRLRRLLDGQTPWLPINPDLALPWAESRLEISFTESQYRALAGLLDTKCGILTGGPGTGKTTILRALHKILSAKRVRMARCSMSAGAANRMEESIGEKATTIHRMLRIRPGDDPATTQPLEADLVIVDEASLTDLTTTYRLLQAIPDQAALLLVGDKDQIPSVGEGRVFEDMVVSGRVPVFELTENRRTAEGSRIAIAAAMVNKGLSPLGQQGGEEFQFIRAEEEMDIQRRVRELVMRTIPREMGIAAQDVQVLSPTHRGVVGTRELNKVIAGDLRKAGPSVRGFAPGDRVVHRRNDYARHVFNGDVGKVVSIDESSGSLVARFDDRQVEYQGKQLSDLSLAYARTMHSTQGREYPAVVIPIVRSHWNMLDRRLLYTAMTRATTRLYLVGQPDAIHKAITTNHSGQRVSGVLEWLRTNYLGMAD